jgi:uncharacterized membrane protein YdjX (TVP38/TMEM64 family)
MSEPSPDPAGAGPGGSRLALRRLLPAGMLLAGLLAFLALGGPRYLDFETLEAHREALLRLVEAYGVLAPLAFIAVYAVMVAFSIPGALVMTVAGGFLFGTLAGALYAVIGATLGAIAVFLAARTALGDFLRDRAGPALQRMRAGFQQDALSYLLVLRLIPLFPFWLVNLVPAFLGVSLKVFMIGTFLGIIPGSLVYASVGNGLGAIFAAGQTATITDAIFEPEVLLPILGLVVLSLLPVIYRRVTHKNVRRDGDGDSARR